MLNIEVNGTLNESSSVTTFLPDEEASICPLLQSSNAICSPAKFTHPLISQTDDNKDNDITGVNEKIETGSSSGSSSGIEMNLPNNSATIFNKNSYQHIQNNNKTEQEAMGHTQMGSNTNQKEPPCFVAWNWPVIRKCTFFAFLSILLGMCAIVVAEIVTLPKTCNQKTAWYRGGVFYELFPASFQDSNNDGVGDLRGIENRIDYFVSLGVSAIRLNSIFPTRHYPEDYQFIISLTKIADVLGDMSDFQEMVNKFHAKNISVILDLPLRFGELELKNDSHSQNNASFLTTKEIVLEGIDMWLKVGVDGFFIKNVESFEHTNYNSSFLNLLSEWKNSIGLNKVTIISEDVLNSLSPESRQQALTLIDLVDVRLDVRRGTKVLEAQINEVLNGPLAPIDNGVWISWSLGGVNQQRLTQTLNDKNLTLAATIMQLMLPGTPSIFYGDEVSLEEFHDISNEHNDTKHLHHLTTMGWSNTKLSFTNHLTLPWIPSSKSYSSENAQVVAKMIHLREHSPSIYKNSNCKTAIVLANTKVRRSHDDILIIERNYPRLNSFISISNFGKKRIKMDMSYLYYRGYNMLVHGGQKKIYFSELDVEPLHTIVVKLDK